MVIDGTGIKYGIMPQLAMLPSMQTFTLNMETAQCMILCMNHINILQILLYTYTHMYIVTLGWSVCALGRGGEWCR